MCGLHHLAADRFFILLISLRTLFFQLRDMKDWREAVVDVSKATAGRVLMALE